MTRLNSWRVRFNELELSQIDAAAPTSLIGRMARLLDEAEAAKSQAKTPKQFLEQEEKDRG